MKTRVKSAVVLIAAMLICVTVSSYTRVLMLCVVGCACAYEYSINVERLEARCTLWVMITYLILQTGLVIFKAPLYYSAVLFIFCLYLSLFSGVLHSKVGGRGALFTLAGLSYPCVLFAVIMLIGATELWIPAYLIAFSATALCDTFALLGGMRFGKHKLAPQVSPNKTIEGSVCGALSSVVVAVPLYLVLKFLYPVSFLNCVIISLVSSTMGQIGDLAESLLKRWIGVKDFSNLIPGHGGFMDRLDSYMFSIPTAYLFLKILGA